MNPACRFAESTPEGGGFALQQPDRLWPGCDFMNRFSQATGTGNLRINSPMLLKSADLVMGSSMPPQQIKRDIVTNPPRSNDRNLLPRLPARQQIDIGDHFRSVETRQINLTRGYATGQNDSTKFGKVMRFSPVIET